MKIGYVIAIDGPSGAGKSTVAKEVARRLGYRYIDTGAMYRAAGLFADREGVDIADESRLGDLLSRLVIRQELNDGNIVTMLGGEDVSDAIRSPDMAMKASAISSVPAVRERLKSLQREMGESGGVVMEGRDIGTVIFPDADYKFFLIASAEERARRRLLDHRAKGEDIGLEELLEQIRKRDRDDSTRAVAPLRRASDAREIDSTGKTIEEVVEEICEAVAAGGAEQE